MLRRRTLASASVNTRDTQAASSGSLPRILTDCAAFMLNPQPETNVSGYALRRAKVKFFGRFLSRKCGIDEEINPMTQMQICSGCDNLVELGEQYCWQCKSDMAQSDWEELQEPDYPCEHSWVTDPGMTWRHCEYCGLYEE